MSNFHVKVKLYGESFKIHSLEINNEYEDRFYDVAKQIGTPLNMALLNVDFFSSLHLKDYLSLDDLIKNTFSGLIHNKKSQVELWIGRKRVEKLTLLNLFHSQTLLPLYQTELTDIVQLKLKKGLYLEEKEIGLIAQYEATIKNFNIDLLKFHLTKCNYSKVTYELLDNISYEGEIIIIKKSDALLMYQNCFFIN